MKKLFISQFAIGVISVLVWSLLGTVPSSQAAGPVNFISNDEPGSWFKCVGNGCVNAGSESLAIVPPNTVVKITNGTQTNSTHTFTSLLYPTGAKGMPFDQNEAFKGSRSVTLKDPGLYVFVCKMHPFMLAATIVDNNGLTDGVLELGDNITLISYPSLPFPTSSDLATRLLRAFFLITNPANYQDHNPLTNIANPPTKPLPMTWHITYPDVLVKTNLAEPLNLKTVLETRYGQNLPLAEPTDPSLIPPGVGEVWIDTEYEKTADKTKPGTATAVRASDWKVTKKVALPEINMNNPHNMWTDKDQTVIYQTQWFDTKLTVFDRNSGIMLQNINVGHAPAHVMTRVDTDQVHVSINGGDDVVELSPGATGIDRRIPTQFPGEKAAQPHAHWMSHDGHTMVTPNSNTGDSTRINIELPAAPIVDKVITGTLPIATGMMPDTSKYYVSNYLDSTITCITISTNPQLSCKDDNGASVPKKTINLLLGGSTLANYDPINGFDIPGPGMSQSGALPIQTPVSPNGKWVVTANTLSGTISIIDTSTDTLVKVLKCSAGCHGVNFGAKNNLINGGYYAYVSSKFSNDLIIVDLDSLEIAGRVLLVAGPGLLHNPPTTVIDDTPTQYQGMGGQGVLPIPLVYNGWVQNLPSDWCAKLSVGQRSPFGSSPAPCTP